MERRDCQRACVGRLLYILLAPEAHGSRARGLVGRSVVGWWSICLCQDLSVKFASVLPGTAVDH